MDNVTAGNNGIGLITPKFYDVYKRDDYNLGNNHSIILYNCGGKIYLATSDDFGKEYKKLHLNSTGSAPLTKNETTITVEIDMVKGIAIFQNNDNKDAHFEINNLPESVALVFSFGGHKTQTVSCTQQEFY